MNPKQNMKRLVQEMFETYRFKGVSVAVHVVPLCMRKVWAFVVFELLLNSARSRERHCARLWRWCRAHCSDLAVHVVRASRKDTGLHVSDLYYTLTRTTVCAKCLESGIFVSERAERAMRTNMPSSSTHYSVTGSRSCIGLLPRSIMSSTQLSKLIFRNCSETF